MAVAVLLVGAFGIGAGEARAQAACAIPDDVPGLVYQAYYEMLNPGFPMGEAACESLTKGALSACHKAVSAVARCWKGLGKGLAKGAKTTCKEQGPDEELCVEGTALYLENLRSNVEASVIDGHESCEGEAEGLFLACLFDL